MKNKPTCIFVISFLLFFSANILAQVNKSEKEKGKKKDTLRLNNSYGLRVGVDLQNIVTSITNPNYSGIEFMGDYRILDRYYLAAELGYQEKTISETSISTTASGSYINVGIDHNAYKNLVGLRNVIFVGLRYGYANFSQDLNGYAIATQDNFFDKEYITDDLFSSSGLSAHWLELIAGLKVEVINNFYVGFSVSVQRNIYDQKPSGFDNHYIPGYGTTNDYGSVSAGYRYFISYYFPLYKRNKKIKTKEEEKIKEEEIPLEEGK